MTEARTYVPPAWDERSTLTAMLRYVRATAVFKCEDLADDLAHAAPLTTSPLSSIGGFINHLRWVEHGSFEHSFRGGPDRAPWTEDEPDRELSLGAEIPLSEALAGYAEQAAITDAIIAEHDLDDRSVWPLYDGGDHPTLRFVVLHMIEETARHNGHLDILREMLDGRIGE
jgi:hypothetical protein